MDTIYQIVNLNEWDYSNHGTVDFPQRIRFRDGLVPEVDVSKYPELIRVFWEFKVHKPRLPNTTELQNMNIFEDQLIDAFQVNLSGVIVAISTGYGYREWVVYCKNKEVISLAWEQITQSQLGFFPITMEATQDPYWNFFFGQMLPYK